MYFLASDISVGDQGMVTKICQCVLRDDRFNLCLERFLLQVIHSVLLACKGRSGPSGSDLLRQLNFTEGFKKSRVRGSVLSGRRFQEFQGRGK